MISKQSCCMDPVYFRNAAKKNFKKQKMNFQQKTEATILILRVEILEEKLHIMQSGWSMKKY